MRIGTKLLIPWGLFCFILVAGFSVFQWEFGQVQKDLNQQLQLHQDAVRLARELRFQSQERLTLALGYHGGPIPPVLNQLTTLDNQAQATIAKLQGLINGYRNRYKDSGFANQSTLLLQRYVSARHNLPDLYEELLHVVHERSPLESIKLLQIKQLVLTVRASLDDLAEFHEISQQLANANARTQFLDFQLVFYAAMGALLLLLLAFSFYQGRSIARPLGQLSKHAQAWSQGEVRDFKVRTDLDEVTHLGQALSDMLDNLRASHAEVVRQEERFQKVVHASPVAMLMVDAEARIVMLNPATETMFGHPKGTLEGRQIERLVPERLRAQHVGLRNHFLQQPVGNFLNAQRGVLGQRADGREFPVEIALTPLQTSEGPMVLAIVVDITDRLALENERRAYQTRLETDVATRTAELRHKTTELQLAMQDLESFSYSVSHDLRSPLRAIDGFVQILRDEHARQLDAEGQRMFSVVQDNARKMGRLIDDILAFSRAGRLEMDWQDIDMDRLLQEVWEAVGHARPGHTAELEALPLPHIQGDPRAVRQILGNLLDNAVKFSRTRHPGHVRVSAENVGAMVRFSVQDNGVGFNPAFASKLFVMFQRLHGETEFEGSGVGLAIVKRFVMKHGGEVQATARPDEGATFTFTLPVDIPVDAPGLADQPAVPGFH